jgi:hypothetical protein
VAVGTTRSVTLKQTSPFALGGVREATLNADPLEGVTALALGGGQLSVAQGTNTIAETLLSYGAFVHGTASLPAPYLALDLSACNGLEFLFDGAEDGLNINVVYFTQAPLEPAHVLFYASSAVNVPQPVSGNPLLFTLPFRKDPAFNWRHVDGVIVLINRAGPTPHTSYTLSRLAFTP